MIVLDVVQTARQKREINPIFYNQRMGTDRAVAMGFIGYVLFDVFEYLVKDNSMLKRIFQESVIYTESENIQANSRFSTVEVRTRDNLYFS